MFGFESYDLPKIDSIALAAPSLLSIGTELTSQTSLHRSISLNAPNGTAALTWRVIAEDPEPTIFATAPTFVGGTQYVPWMDPELRLSQPVTFNGSIQLQIGTKAPFDVGTSLHEMGNPRPYVGEHATQLGNEINFPARTVLFPSATTWSGRTAAARVLTLTLIVLEPRVTLDFSSPEDAVPSRLALAGGAAIKTDPECATENGRCLVISAPTASSNAVCTELPAALFYIKTGSSGLSRHLKYRIMGQNEHDNAAFTIQVSDGASTSPFSGLPPGSVPGFAYDSGWVAHESIVAGKQYLMTILGCHPGIKVLVQGVTEISPPSP